MPRPVAFVDLETSRSDFKIMDAGAVTTDGKKFHAASVQKLLEFLNPYSFIAGHNIVAHDLHALHKSARHHEFPKECIIDTLLLSPLFFPNKPYHNLLKDDKLNTYQLNNPLLDAEKAKQLFQDERSAFEKMNPELKTILAALLRGKKGFHGFFQWAEATSNLDRNTLSDLIKQVMKDSICDHAPVERFIEERPVELSYSLMIILSTPDSIAPNWLLRNFPFVQTLVRALANTPCLQTCTYCIRTFDPSAALQKYFKYTSFRLYEGVALQEDAIRAALRHESILAIFPTGGGKSITFQLPALMAGDCGRELTVVISPLQSLMKDQVDNLDKKGIQCAVAINGLLDPLERELAVERVANGTASLLYISPESLRSTTIERLLLARKIARVVIDEAHCFSSWGQDFRVDYLYIGPFLKKLQADKQLSTSIPISCFTATAKQKVIEDISTYFEKELNLSLTLFHSSARRTNLSYKVFEHPDEEDKYVKLRSIIEENSCPTIIYVSRTKKAEEVSARLSRDGFPANHFHGKMEVRDKMKSQDDFVQNKVDIMVATSAFGMGVDKDNVKRVIHYEISDSLESYVQEAGRAGRNEEIKAECFVLFNESDLDAHFNLLQQSKITKQEINQIWKAIKDMTNYRSAFSSSALDIARKAGWDENIRQLETRVTTAIAALEIAGYLIRGQNAPRVYATSIRQKNADEAISQIEKSGKILGKDKIHATRIVRKLFSARSKRKSQDEDAEARVDYIADQLGISVPDAIKLINALREEGILADERDLTAFVRKSETQTRLTSQLIKHNEIEDALLALLNEDRQTYNLKELSEKIEISTGINPGSALRSIIHFWGLKLLVDFKYEDGSRHHVTLEPRYSVSNLKVDSEKRHLIANLIAIHLLSLSKKTLSTVDTEEVLVEFSVLELKNEIQKSQGLFKTDIQVKDVENTLLYLSRIDALKIEGGFLVTYNRMRIERKETNNLIKYKDADYETLKIYYKQKMAQIHIVGEYARLMAYNYEKALRFVDDYFALNSSSFLSKYFNRQRQHEINEPLTPKTFKKLFGDLSPNQQAIVRDKDSQHIVVAAGPGSGKTKVLVHKLASLISVEEIKQEQLLMLTFSRAAATEFKSRLLKLIGRSSAWVEIKTFHSYCFDLLDKIGSMEGVDNIVSLAAEKIRSHEIDQNKITKTVLVIDEAQDMNKDDYSLVLALMETNEDMRTVLVGDDDQNIFQFRGASAQFMKDHLLVREATKYELVDNYRSKEPIVSLSNRWVAGLAGRLKKLESLSMVSGSGLLEIRQWITTKLVLPTIDTITQTELTGTTAVLTQTNDQADIIVGLLKHKGWPAKLIQSNDGFKLSKMIELEKFTTLVAADLSDPVISDDLWEESHRKLYKEFGKSSNIMMVDAIIRRFASVNPDRKYKTDWDQFLFESKLEDFISITSDNILVSTIHKSKGREFDNVFLVIEKPPATEEDKRAIYVGMTRAKTALRIEYNGDYLKSMIQNLGSYEKIKRFYNDPPKLSLTLSLKDIYLSASVTYQDDINQLMPGDELHYIANGLAKANGKTVLRYSKQFREKLARYEGALFRIETARVNYIVFWWNKEAKTELKVVLPEIVLTKIL